MRTEDEVENVSAQQQSEDLNSLHSLGNESDTIIYMLAVCTINQIGLFHID